MWSMFVIEGCRITLFNSFVTFVEVFKKGIHRTDGALNFVSNYKDRNKNYELLYPWKVLPNCIRHVTYLAPIPVLESSHGAGPYVT
jgi:hypothetical protein